MENNWQDKFISEENGEFIAWDEIHYSELGRVKTREEAVRILNEYAKSLEGEDHSCIGCRKNCKNKKG